MQNVAWVLSCIASVALASWPDGPQSDLIAARTLDASITNVVAIFPGPDGGVIAVWEENTSGNKDISAEWVSADGRTQWGTGRGRKLVATVSDDAVQAVTPAAEGGFYLAYVADAGVRVSHFDPNGVLNERFVSFTPSSSVGRLVAAADGGVFVLTGSTVTARVARLGQNGVALADAAVVSSAMQVRGLLLVTDRRDGVFVRSIVDDNVPRLNRYGPALQPVFQNSVIGDGPGIDVSRGNVTGDFDGGAWVSGVTSRGLLIQHINAGGLTDVQPTVVRATTGLLERSLQSDLSGGAYSVFAETDRLEVVHFTAQGRFDWSPSSRTLGTGIVGPGATWARPDSLFVTWATATTVVAQRLFADGGVLLPAPFVVSNQPMMAPENKRILLNGRGPSTGPMAMAMVSANSMGIDGPQVRLKCVPYALQWPDGGLLTCFDEATEGAGGTSGIGGAGSGGTTGSGGSQPTGGVGARPDGGALVEGDLVPLPRGCGCGPGGGGAWFLLLLFRRRGVRLHDAAVLPDVPPPVAAVTRVGDV